MYPIIIGGLGGSGTRVVTQILIECRVHMGMYLNVSLDNILFSYLFKRTELFKYLKQSKIRRRLRTFEKLSTGKIPSIFDLCRLAKIIITDHILKKSIKNYFRMILRRIKYKKTYKPVEKPIVRWGWKEPMTYVYLDYLINRFKDFKYIFVVRNGLDMAFSNNLQHLNAWAFLFDLKSPKSKELIPSSQLDYWIKTNEKMLEYTKNYKDIFYILNFDNLCINPREEITKLLDFLNLKVDNQLFGRLIEIPKIPSTMGRWKTRPDCFSESQKIQVKKYGFNIEK